MTPVNLFAFRCLLTITEFFESNCTEKNDNTWITESKNEKNKQTNKRNDKFSNIPKISRDSHTRLRVEQTQT